MPTIAPDPSRLKRLIVLRDRISAGKDVARRDLKNALTDGEWDEFEEALNSPLYANHAQDSRPPSLDRYVELLAKADFLYSRAESTPVTSRSRRDAYGRPGRQRLYESAERQFELAIEYLSEILSTANIADEHEIRTWLDRPVDFAHGKEPFPSPAGVPRLLGSRSQHVEGRPLSKHEQKRVLKLEAIENAIRSLQTPAKQRPKNTARPSSSQANALRAFARNR